MTSENEGNSWLKTLKLRITQASQFRKETNLQTSIAQQELEHREKIEKEKYLQEQIQTETKLLTNLHNIQTLSFELLKTVNKEVFANSEKLTPWKKVKFEEETRGGGFDGGYFRENGDWESGSDYHFWRTISYFDFEYTGLSLLNGQTGFWLIVPSLVQEKTTSGFKNPPKPVLSRENEIERLNNLTIFAFVGNNIDFKNLYPLIKNLDLEKIGQIKENNGHTIVSNLSLIISHALPEIIKDPDHFSFFSLRRHDESNSDPSLKPTALPL